MYNLTFKNVVEIRMGSPFHMAEVLLTGGYAPDFSPYTFQDLGLVNQTGDTVYLIQWEIEKNEPGFRVWRISSDEKKIYKTAKFGGCCRKLTLQNHELNIEIEYGGQTTKITVHPQDYKIFA